MNGSTRWIGLAVFIAICLGAGGLGAVVRTPEIEGWYRTLQTPTRLLFCQRRIFNSREPFSALRRLTLFVGSTPTSVTNAIPWSSGEDPSSTLGGECLADLKMQEGINELYGR